jgi:3-hydroxybutyryl-CoA dehydratase
MTYQNPIQSYCIEDLSVGMNASYAKTVTDEDIVRFADISGDINPVHLDQAYAEKTMFKGRIAHGMLSAAFISTVFGTRLPGAGCIYLSQSLRFKAPVKIGETVEATVTVTAVDAAKRRVTFQTVCRVGDKVVVDGEALLMVASRERIPVAAE